jgi:hypothetical protein
MSSDSSVRRVRKGRCDAQSNQGSPADKTSRILKAIAASRQGAKQLST